jgi:glycerophosphoryl diester phosphodiesterase
MGHEGKFSPPGPRHAIRAAVISPVWARSNAPLVIGHRGASAHEPENSVAAFKRAALDGADGVELDVLCCASGEVIVFHDDDLMRLAGRPERVASLPWSELREVTLSGGAHIPTLTDALEACGPSLLVNVELKSDGLRDRSLPALVTGVAAAVDRAGAARRVLVSSFNPAAVWRWRRHRPDIAAALLFERRRSAWCVPFLRPFAVHPDQRLCTAASVRAWHAAGYAVNTWTVDDPARIRELDSWNVDAIITNVPDVARAALLA